MKRFWSLILTAAMLVSFAACGGGGQEDMAEVMDLPRSKDGVAEFFSVIGGIEGEGLLAGAVMDEAHCWNVTPAVVAAQTDIQIFKFSTTALSLALIDGEVYQICTSFGGHGFVNAVPWDYDGDGVMDLLVASSWGSGLHRSEISVFNGRTKESTVVYDTLESGDPSADLIVTVASPAFSSKDPQDPVVWYQVYSAELEADDGMLVSCTEKELVGTVEAEDGVPVFVPYSE